MEHGGMKIFFSTGPGLGHFLPVVPLAWAARAAGHDVMMVTAGPAIQACASAGLPAIDAFPDFDFKDMTKRNRKDVQGFRYPFSDAALPFVAKMMAGISDKMADRTVEMAKSWKPDLIVHTPFNVNGSLAATLLSIPTVVHGFGLLSIGKLTGLTDLIYENMRPACERNGVTSELVRPTAIIDTCPPSMREADRPPAWFCRYVPYNGGGSLPDWLVEAPSRRRICVTLGTALPHVAGVGGVSGVIDAVRNLDVDVILALGGTDASVLGALPSNVRTVGWIPLSALVPTCSAIVHHGGAGTTMNALVAGVPQLIVPHMADQHGNARAVQQRSVGLMHLPEDANAQTVQRSLRQLLEDSNFTQAAQEVRQENENQIPPADIVPHLVELSGRG
jgi:UDP:flavonoid glycosyltransferase YjiC (YdhE family)